MQGVLEKKLVENARHSLRVDLQPIAAHQRSSGCTIR